MENFLRLVEQLAASEEVAIDAEKLKFFNRELKIWDYAKISSSDYQKLSFEDKFSILKSYYVDMSCTLGTGTIIIFCFFWLNSLQFLQCWSGFFTSEKIVWMFF